MRPCPARFSVIVAWVLVALGLGATSSDAHAQAWVGGKGSLDLGLDYNLGVSDKVVVDEPFDINNDGVPDDAFSDAGTTTHQITVGAEFVPVSRLAVNVALPIAFLKYTGDRTIFMHPGGGSYDDGEMHTTLTDLRVGARYQVLEDPIALSPHLAVTIPVADYETIGNTVAGRHLKALHVGLGIGRVIGTSTYVHLLYEFSLVEKYDRTADTAQHGQNRSDLAFTIGHKLLGQRLDIHLDANLRATHGGINFSEFAAGTLSADEGMYHDAILKEDILLAGAGVGYQISNSLSVTLAARLFVTGSNTQNASVLAFGVGWSPL
jgi:hypothetical protein